VGLRLRKHHHSPLGRIARSPSNFTGDGQAQNPAGPMGSNPRLFSQADCKRAECSGVLPGSGLARSQFMEEVPLSLGELNLFAFRTLARFANSAVTFALNFVRQALVSVWWWN
jgi:hypothetical protein